MANINSFEYDIFISYAHKDNIPTSYENIGWIEKFYKDLEILLTRSLGKPVKIWWDNRKLDGNVVFNDSIAEGIRQSAILICLNSPSYVSSDYCKTELDLFYNKAQQEPFGLKVNNRFRILNVLLYNIPFTKWSAELSGTSGFPFHDAKEADDEGDPLDTKLPEFENQMKSLKDAILKLIKDFPKEAPLAPVQPTLTAPAEKPVVQEEKKDAFTIYMAEVADSLRSVRKRTITELEKSGYTIVYGVPPPDEALAHEQKVTEALQQAQLAVHLLDDIPGREITGTPDIWYPQKQAELGLQFAKSQMIWMPAETDNSIIEEIEDEKYKLFLKGLEGGKTAASKYDFVRGSKSELVQQIIDKAEELKQQPQQQPQTGKEKISVLLDTHFNDSLFALSLYKSLLNNQIEPLLNPEEDDPRKNMNILAERIRQVTKLVFFYGQVSKEWVTERMTTALQLIVNNRYPINGFYVYLLPPRKDPAEISLLQQFLHISVIDNSGDNNLDTASLQQFVKTLKGEAA